MPTFERGTGSELTGRQPWPRLVVAQFHSAAQIDHSWIRDAANGRTIESLFVVDRHRHGRRICGACDWPSLAIFTAAEVLSAVPETAAALGPLGLDKHLDLLTLRLPGRPLEKRLSDSTDMSNAPIRDRPARFAFSAPHRTPRTATGILWSR